MYVILTRSELLFIYKTVQEIISIPRADLGYPHNSMVDSWVFKNEESESEDRCHATNICGGTSYLSLNVEHFITFCRGRMLIITIMVGKVAPSCCRSGNMQNSLISGDIIT